MNRFNLKEITSWTSGIWQNGVRPESISGFCFDARIIQPDECFVALSCGARDGHEFVQQAMDNGAGSLLLERPQNVSLPQIIVDDSLIAMGAIASGIRRQFSSPVIGITGSCGKTSTKEMLRMLLGNERTHVTPGNWNNLIGVPMTLFGLDQKQHDFAVIEAGINQPDEMSLLGAIIQCDLTIVTNIGPAHLELLSTLENIAAEKSLLAQHSKVDAPLVLPYSALHYPAFSDYIDRAIIIAEEGEVVDAEPGRIIYYSLELSSAFSKLTLRNGYGIHTFEIASPSKGICTNAALAITAARHLGLADSVIEKRLRTWTPASKRGRVEKQGDQTFYIDCYNANPASMSDALAAFSQLMPPDEPRCYVIGTMNELGESAESMHREIGGKLELRSSDRVFFVGPEALTKAYAEGAIKRSADPKQLESITDANVIESAVKQFSGNIFLKGSRSHQLEKILPGDMS